jgi:hypothetical protein
MSKETWTEPQASWVPLKTAVFKFGIFDDASASSEEQLSATTSEMRTSGNRSLTELTNLVVFVSFFFIGAIDPEPKGLVHAEFDCSSCQEGRMRRVQ